MRYHELVMETPDYILRRYMRGKCLAFAIALQRRIKLPMWGLFAADGTLHHVFLADAATRQAYDVRGRIPLDEVPKGSMAQSDADMRPISRQEAEAVMGRPDRADIVEAGREIDTGFNWLVASANAPPVSSPKPERAGEAPPST